MKTVMTMMILLVGAALWANPASAYLNTETEQKSDAKMCKMFEKKIEDYKSHMRHDAYAKATLQSYQERAKAYCAH